MIKQNKNMETPNLKKLFYKLIKDYPNHKIGDVATFDSEVCWDNFFWVDSINNTNSGIESIPTEFQPDVTPEWFEECLFISEDGVPIFKSDEYWYIQNLFNLVDSATAKSERHEYIAEKNIIRFSSKEFAEKYLKKSKHIGIKFEFAVTMNGDTKNYLMYSPSDYKNIEHIGHDVVYGDVFKCWNDTPNEFTLYLGKKS